ncbi:MAG: TonB-dependent siderophore receptor [Delftia acidovorans]|uniref:TonB-dependent siderophore receptor n=1 Tax=Delftia acidovorans TaxID=80866 RepID=A0A7T2S3X7_DELAC|nr:MULTISPECIES: TonB-dependent siderophore receptor [Delftia]MBB1650689.1 TonB-dependent receptor [Delftia sp. UME58]MBL8355742.1 TonB-dependent siderophore receptor [Delftia acidovorans]QPS08459.1 TonB-dependent siderophore receptor [Delftia acidovorans]
MRSLPRHHLLSTALATAFGSTLMLHSPLASAQPQAQATAQVFDIDVPAQPLAGALNELSRQTGLPVFASGELLSGLQSRAVTARLTPEQALHQMLSDTSLEAVRTASGGFSIRRSPSPSAQGATLPTVLVREDALRESATGPIQGYVASRSATGTKTDTPLIETPQSISVVGAEEIDTMKSQSIQDALGYVAGVSRFEGLSRVQDTIYIRGFQAQAATGSVYRDGTKYTVNAFNGKQEIYGLERIEVLKGAASVLYGSAGPGGIINMVSKRPTSTPLHELNLELGSFGRKQISGDFGGPLDKDGDWSYRMTFLQRDSNTFVDHVRDDRTFIAPALKWQPNASTSLTLLADYQKDKTNYVYWLPAQGTIFPTIYGKIPRNRFTGEPGYSKFDVERYSIGYLFEHAFNDKLKLRNSLRYFHANSDFPQVWVSGLAADQRTSAFRGGTLRWERSSSLVADTSLQYQAKHGNIEHTVLVGFDYTRPKNQSERYDRTAGNIDYYNPIYGGALGEPTRDNWWSYNADTRQVGLYVQDQMKIADKWVALVGGRYDYARDNQSNLFTGEKSIDNEKNKAFTGRAGLVYLADNGLAPFLSFSQSFEPTSGRDRLGSRFDPSTGTQYEIGTRYQPPGSSTLISASLYQLTRQNVSVTDPVDPTYSAQIGEVRSRGFELEARTSVGRNANLIAAYAYTDARTTQASPLQPSQVGMRSPGIPYHQFSIWGDYNFGRFGMPNLKVGAGMRYQGETKPNAGNFDVPSFTLFDAMVSYTTGPWRLALNVTNLFDKTYVGSCTTGCFYGEPRKAIATATYRW